MQFACCLCIITVNEKLLSLFEHIFKYITEPKLLHQKWVQIFQHNEKVWRDHQNNVNTFGNNDNKNELLVN